MSATDTRYTGRHRTRSAADLTPGPQIVVENIAAIMGAPDTLYVSAVDADTHNLLGIDFGPAATAALRDALSIHVYGAHIADVS